MYWTQDIPVSKTNTVQLQLSGKLQCLRVSVLMEEVQAARECLIESQKSRWGRSVREVCTLLELIFIK